MPPKKTTKKAAPKKAAAPKAAPAFDMWLSTDEPRAHMEFTVTASGLEPLETATLTMGRPGGSIESFSLQAGPTGNAYWILRSPESGEHQLEVAAGDKTVVRTLTVL